MKRTMAEVIAFFTLFFLSMFGSALGYTEGRQMDDAVMNDVNSLSLSQIEAITAHSPCLATYTDTGFHWDGTEWRYGETWSAAKIIFEAAHMWVASPKMVIAKLQQEESLISGTSCEEWRYKSAMGYACPDKGSCNPKYAGFSLQVLWGTWQLKFNEERSQGHTAWDEDGNLPYSGIMLKGLFARCESCELSEFSGKTSIEGQEIYVETGATASLLSYTPHLGFSFVERFEEYFGSPLVEEVKSEEPPKEEVKPPAEETKPPVTPITQQVVTPNSGPPPASSGSELPTSHPEPPPRCIVPRLKGKTLAQAQKLLKKAHCELGKVTRPKKHSRHKLVVDGQSLAVGQMRHPGFKVAVRLG